MCTRVYSCFLFTLNQGLRAGGGIGDVMAFQGDAVPTYTARLFFDLTFFVIVTVILMNVIFGIIIDTFADLRTVQQSKHEDMKTVCFICNIPRTTFDQKGEGFETHVAYDHNMWAYVNFLVHIRLKEKTELTGLESDVWAKIVESNTSFFPLHKALCVEGHDVEEEREKQEAEERMNRLLVDMASIKQSLASQSQLLRSLLAVHGNGHPGGNGELELSRPPSSAPM